MVTSLTRSGDDIGPQPPSALRVAGGDVSVEVPYAERKDEIGALAGAMQAFKDSLTEADRLRHAQRETEERGVEQRKTEMRRLADEFQTTVGNIVNAVSTASGELEKAAGTLTTTAENTQKLSCAVASASEEASANVQTVASAAHQRRRKISWIPVVIPPGAETFTSAETRPTTTRAVIGMT